MPVKNTVVGQACYTLVFRPQTNRVIRLGGMIEH